MQMRFLWFRARCSQRFLRVCAARTAGSQGRAGQAEGGAKIAMVASESVACFRVAAPALAAAWTSAKAGWWAVLTWPAPYQKAEARSDFHSRRQPDGARALALACRRPAWAFPATAF